MGNEICLRLMKVNQAGVTVERREGHVKFNGTNLNIVDPPGTYSLTSSSQG